MCAAVIRVLCSLIPGRRKEGSGKGTLVPLLRRLLDDDDQVSAADQRLATGRRTQATAAGDGEREEKEGDEE